MASTSETGHAVNIANFKILIERCNEFGGTYNPPISEISVAAMTSKLNDAIDAHKTYIVALEGTKIPINDREILYNDLTKLVVRVYNLYLATKASAQSKRDAKGYMLKITGRNVKIHKLADGVTPDPSHISNSQLSYVQKADYFDKLVQLLKIDTHYTPNETALQISSLEGWNDNIVAANNQVINVTTNAIVKRTVRDHALYDLGTGLIDLAISCKKYVKGLFGAKTPEADSVVSIKFRRIMKLNAV